MIRRAGTPDAYDARRDRHCEPPGFWARGKAIQEASGAPCAPDCRIAIACCKTGAFDALWLPSDDDPSKRNALQTEERLPALIVGVSPPGCGIYSSFWI